jgi:zinc protease
MSAAATDLTSLLQPIESELENGLKLRLFPDKTAPGIVSLQLFYRVGSRNERPGLTGISHLFEHMMFNGAKKYGPKQFDKTLEEWGGSSNAYTSNDFTSYYEAFPPEALETVCDLESDRMRSLSIHDEVLNSEREVVKEERRSVVDNDIAGSMHEELEALMYKAHPYRWPVIGWMGDLDRIDREACQSFFRMFYAPNNAVLYLSGDFDAGAATQLIEKYFGDIPRGPPIPDVPNEEPEQHGERRAELHRSAQASSLVIGYRAPPAGHPDMAVLDVIQYALGVGEGSRLIRKLVFEQGLCSGLGVDWGWRIGPGSFTFFLELPPEGQPKVVEKALFTELEKVATHGLTELELRRAKNNLRSNLLRELATHRGRTESLGQYEMTLGSWRDGVRLADVYQKVTRALVKQVARKYFDPTQRSIITLVPTAP